MLKKRFDGELMKISLIQMNMTYQKPDENFNRAAFLIQKAAKCGCDTAVLPEMWNTGFLPKDNFETLLDKNCERVKSQIGSLAKELNINIVAGSVANIRNGKHYNTACIFDRSGKLVLEYDKTHLFYPMGEDRYFTAGNSPCAFTLDGIKCSVIICFDIRFDNPVKAASENSSLVFTVSQWPNVRINQLEALAKEHAENYGVYYAVCNSCGTAGETVYGGSSFFCGKDGKVIKKAGETEEILTADILFD